MSGPLLVDGLPFHRPGQPLPSASVCTANGGKYPSVNFEPHEASRCVDLRAGVNKKAWMLNQADG